MTRYFLFYCTAAGGMKLHIYREERHADMQWTEATRRQPIWGFYVSYHIGTNAMTLLHRTGEVK